MNEIEIGFSCLPNNFQQENNFIYNTLSRKYKVRLSENPEFLFYSSFAGERPNARVSTFFTGENRRPNMKDCDWAFGFNYENEIKNNRYMRLPLYVLHTAGLRDFWYQLPDLLEKSKHPNQLNKSFADFQQREFCVYIAANETLLRAKAFEIINKVEPVTAPGKSKNNAAPIGHTSSLESRLDPDWQQDKIEYMRRFKFALVFENHDYPGYTTEKISDAMVAGCIPIYWGNPSIQCEFNLKSFYNLTPYVDRIVGKLPDSLKSKTDRISRKLVHLAKNRGLKEGITNFLHEQSDDDLLFEKFKQPWLNQQQLNDWFDFSRYENRLYEIVEN